MRGVNSTGGNRHEFHGPALGGWYRDRTTLLGGRGRTGQHPGRAGDLSGFPGQFVGFLVGFLDLPDTHLICVINELEVICRVCRVFLGVESSGEFGERKNGGHRRRANMTAPASVLDSTWTPKGHLRRVRCL